MSNIPAKFQREVKSLETSLDQHNTISKTGKDNARKETCSPISCQYRDFFFNPK